jgi:GGDEF domain-containing protein
LLLLLDADLESALGVIERLLDRLERYRFESPLTVNVGAACCPTHGADAETLRRAVVLTPALPRERPDSEIL